MYHANLFVGSNKTKLELWVSSTEHQIALFGGHECVNCDINGGFNPFNSDTHYTESHQPWVETCMIYNKDSRGANIQPNSFVGTQVIDNVRIVDPSRSWTDGLGDNGKPSLMFEGVPYLSITMASNRFETAYDGFIGLSPWFQQEDRYVVFNFLYNLRYHEIDPIEHCVVSFFITSKPDKYSFIKFGSYDQKAIKDGGSLKMMKTRNMGTWAVDLHSVKLFDYDFEFENDETFIIYEPQLPYLYLPEEDFMTFVIKASNHFGPSNINCNYNHGGFCYFYESCESAKIKYREGNLLNLGIGDFTGKAFTIKTFLDEILIPGNLLGETKDKCFLGVFKSTETNQDTWYMGNQIIKDYYIVFDASPADEHNHHFIQMGIAEKNPDHIYELSAGSEFNIKYDPYGNEIQ